MTTSRPAQPEAHRASRAATRSASLALLALVATACATTPDPFARHDRFMAQRDAEQVAESRTVCPVVLSNSTDRQIDAGYRIGQVQSMLGLIPAGRSLSFGVLCDAGPIEAYGVADQGGLLGGAETYRTVRALDPAGTTRVHFSVSDRVR